MMHKGEQILSQTSSPTTHWTNGRKRKCHLHYIPKEPNKKHVTDTTQLQGVALFIGHDGQARMAPRLKPNLEGRAIQNMSDKNQKKKG